MEHVAWTNGWRSEKEIDGGHENKNAQSRGLEETTGIPRGKFQERKASSSQSGGAEEKKLAATVFSFFLFSFPAKKSVAIEADEAKI